MECPFERDRKILQYLLTVPVFSDDGKELWTSCRCGVAGYCLVSFHVKLLLPRRKERLCPETSLSGK